MSTGFLHFGALSSHRSSGAGLSTTSFWRPYVCSAPHLSPHTSPSRAQRQMGRLGDRRARRPPTSRPASQSVIQALILETTVSITQLLDPTSWHQLPGDSFALTQIHMKTLTHVCYIHQTFSGWIDEDASNSHHSESHSALPSLWRPIISIGVISQKNKDSEQQEFYSASVCFVFFNRSTKTYQHASNKTIICDFQMSWVLSKSNVTGI